MPATAVHAFFVNDVYDILPSDYRKNLDLKRCKMFAQSTDSCLFYNLLSVFPGKDIRNFQEVFHKNNTQEFFINVLRYIRDNNINDIDTFSFLVGFISHYALDSIMHPYIIYKTGYFNKKDMNTYKYHSKHHFMETFLDNDMISKRFNMNPYQFNISDYCFKLDKLSYDLNNTIDYSFYNTFKIKNMSSIYYKSLVQMKTFIRLFRQDRYGIKRFLYKLIDSFTMKSAFRFDTLSYHYPLEDRFNYLNNDHKIWRNPTTYNIVSNDSFIDLYLKAIKFAKVLVCASFDYINGKDIDLEKVFDNRSYVTGLNCDLKKKLKYFEF